MNINNVHCLALNYRGIGVSDQDPIYFLKSTNCLTYENSNVTYPTYKVDKQLFAKSSSSGNAKKRGRAPDQNAI